MDVTKSFFVFFLTDNKNSLEYFAYIVHGIEQPILVNEKSLAIRKSCSDNVFKIVGREWMNGWMEIIIVPLSASIN